MIRAVNGFLKRTNCLRRCRTEIIGLATGSRVLRPSEMGAVSFAVNAITGAVRDPRTQRNAGFIPAGEFGHTVPHALVPSRLPSRRLIPGAAPSAHDRRRHADGRRPQWARLERQLLAANLPACREFYDKYYDERGYLQAFLRWGANDGPDDAFENFNRWPELHALGADDEILRLYLKALGGHDAPVLRGEDDRRAGRPRRHVRQGLLRPVRLDAPRRGLAALQPDGALGAGPPGLSRARAALRRPLHGRGSPTRRTTTADRKLIRSMINGSRGPMLRQATALDWVGDPFDTTGFVALHGESTYAQFLEHYQEYTDVVGDHFLNLVATTLPTNAYLLTGEAKYRALDRRLHGRVAGADEAERRHHPELRRSRRHDRRARAAVVGQRLRLGVQPGQSGDRPARGSQPHPARAGRLQQCAARHRRSKVRRCLARHDRPPSTLMRACVDGRTEYPTMHGADGLVWLAAEPWSVGALEVWYWSMRQARS